MGELVTHPDGPRSGTVREVLSTGNFRVEFIDGTRVVAHISGKARRLGLSVSLGDKVTVVISPYVAARGRIIDVLSD